MKKMKRVTAGFLAATLVLGNSMDALAASGYGQFHNAITLPFAERTFASDAQSQIDADMGGGDRAGYWVATGLAEEMTSTLRSSSAPKGIQEPLGYGKWWYRAHGDVGIKGGRYIWKRNPFRWYCWILFHSERILRIKGKHHMGFSNGFCSGYHGAC